MPNHIQNRVTFDCSEEKLNEILTAIQKDSGENGNFGPGTVDFNKIIPMPDNIFKGLLGTEEKKIYGKNNWYDWSIEHWGTKWNAYSFPVTETPSDSRQHGRLPIRFSQN